MVTNTSRWLTCFSDLALEPEAAIFPSNKEILAYLKRYARRFDIVSQVHFCTRVELIEHNPQGVGWLVRSNGAEEKSEIFPYVIVASGRFNKPLVPPLPGLDSFCGQLGVLHSFGYKDPESFRRKRVLVIGCAISALEIASDLAMLGLARCINLSLPTLRHAKACGRGTKRPRAGTASRASCELRNLSEFKCLETTRAPLYSYPEPNPATVR